MLISQLIAHLHALQSEHGDLPVYRHVNEGVRMTPVGAEYTGVCKPDEPDDLDDNGEQLPPLFVVVS